MARGTDTYNPYTPDSGARPPALTGRDSELARLPLIPSLTAEAKSYAERMFIYTAIGELGEPAARDALIKPAEAQKVSWDEDGVAEVMAYTEGYPYFIQEYGRSAWDLKAGKRITLEDTRAAKLIVEADLDENFFEGRIGRLSDAERAYVSAMATLGDGPQDSNQVARAPGAQAHIAVADTRRADAQRRDLRTKPRTSGLHRAALRSVRTAPLPNLNAQLTHNAARVRSRESR